MARDSLAQPHFPTLHNDNVVEFALRECNDNTRPGSIRIKASEYRASCAALTKATAEKEKSIPLPPVLLGLALIAGVGLVAVGYKKP